MFSVTGASATTHGQAERGRRAETGHDGRRAHHVVLHLAHRRGGLQRDPAGVERDALADEDDGGASVARRVLADEEHGRARAARVDAEQAAHLLAGDRGAVEHRQLEAGPSRERLRLPRELERAEVVAGHVPEVPRPGDRPGDRVRIPDVAGESARESSARQHDRLGRRRPRVALRLVTVERIVRERQVREDRAHGRVRDPLVEAHDDPARPPELGPLERAAQGGPQPGRRGGLLTEAAQRPVSAGHHLPGLARETRGARRRTHAGTRGERHVRRGILAGVQERDARDAGRARRGRCGSDSHSGATIAEADLC